MFDSKGLIHGGRDNLDSNKQFFANHSKDVAFEDAFKDADVF